MKMLAAMAWRNLWRNKVRSSLTLGAMIFGLVVCLVIFAIGDGAHQQMVRVATSTYLGHMQINQQGFHKQQKLHLVLSHKSPPVKLLKAATSAGNKAALSPWQRQIKAWTPRAFGAGLVSTGKNSAGGMLLGLDLQRESQVTRLPEALLKAMAQEALQSGKYKERLPAGYLADLRARLAKLQEGQTLPKEEDQKRAQKAKWMRQALDAATRKLLKTKAGRGAYKKLLGKREVVLGEGLATVLKAKVGAKIAVVTQAYDGSMGNDRYTVAAIIRSGSADMDLSLCLMPLAQLQELLAMEGMFHTAVLRLHTDDGGAIQRVANAFAAQLQAAGSKVLTHASDKALSHKAPKAWELLSWQRANPDLYEFIRADEAGQFLMTIIVFFLVAFVILNTLQMSLMERTREFGVLMSLGMRGRKLVGMVLMEALCMSGFAIAMGLALGLPIMFYLQSQGLPLGEPLQMGGVTLALKLQGKITMQGLLYSPAVVLLTTLFVSFYPAYRVTRLKPTEALRQV